MKWNYIIACPRISEGDSCTGQIQVQGYSRQASGYTPPEYENIIYSCDKCGYDATDEEVGNPEDNMD